MSTSTSTHSNSHDRNRDRHRQRRRSSSPSRSRSRHDRHKEREPRDVRSLDNDDHKLENANNGNEKLSAEMAYHTVYQALPFVTFPKYGDICAETEEFPEKHITTKSTVEICYNHKQHKLHATKFLDNESVIYGRVSVNNLVFEISVLANSNQHTQFTLGLRAMNAAHIVEKRNYRRQEIVVSVQIGGNKQAERIQICKFLKKRSQQIKFSKLQTEALRRDKISIAMRMESKAIRDKYGDVEDVTHRELSAFKFVLKYGHLKLVASGCSNYNEDIVIKLMQSEQAEPGTFLMCNASDICRDSLYMQQLFGYADDENKVVRSISLNLTPQQLIHFVYFSVTQKLAFNLALKDSFRMLYLAKYNCNALLASKLIIHINTLLDIDNVKDVCKLYDDLQFAHQACINDVIEFIKEHRKELKKEGIYRELPDTIKVRTST